MTLTALPAQADDDLRLAETGTRPASARPHGPRIERLAVSLGLVLIAIAHSVNLAGWPRYFDDEGTYYSQSWAVQNLGALAPYTYWYDHPPVGWLQLAAFTWLPDLLVDGNSSLLSGRIVMVGYTVVSAALLYMLGRRLGMTRFWSLAAMLLWGLNPLVLFEGRQVFLDNVALPWLLAAFVLALNHRRHLGLHMAAGFCFAIAVLSKETTLLFVIPLLLAIWQSAYRPTRSFALMGFSAVLAMTGAMYLLFALIRSELFPGSDSVSLWEALAFQIKDREGSGSILDPEGPEGGAYVTFQSWLQLDPYLLLGGVAAGVTLLAVRRLRPVGVAVVVASLVALRPDGYLPQMYVVALLPFCALAVVGVFDVLWQRSAGLRGWALLPAAVLVVLVGSLAGAGAAGTLAVGDWGHSYSAAWAEDANDTQAAMLEEVSRLPNGAVIAVDNTYWNDLVEQGRDRNDVVWFFKVDNDGTIRDELGGSYLGLDYLVWTTYMSDNAGTLVQEAYRHSRLVTEMGEGEDAVELRRVLSVSEEAALEKQEADAVAAQLAAELAELERFLAQPSARYPSLTNGQIEAIRQESPTTPAAQLARRYETTEAVVRDVVSERE
jgi:hypothetical protein